MIFPKVDRTYWILQGLIIGVVGCYVVSMSLGILVFVSNSQMDHQNSDTVTILLLIESNHPSYSFNYSFITSVPINQSLIECLNNTIGRENWDGQYYGIGGWFIKRIYNATEQGTWQWLYYYRVQNTTNWNFAPVGVSSFKMDHDFDIKFVFNDS